MADSPVLVATNVTYCVTHGATDHAGKKWTACRFRQLFYFENPMDEHTVLWSDEILEDIAQQADGEQRITAALASFGLTCTGEFWQRYHSDAWVFNLANALERLWRSTEGDPTSIYHEVAQLRAQLNAGRDEVDWPAMHRRMKGGDHA